MAGYQDWDDLGKNIQDIIDRAVNSHDYQKLNQTISQAVEKAVDTGSEAMRKAREINYNRNRGKVVYTYAPAKEQPAQQNLPVLYGNTTGKTAKGIMKTIGGSLLSLSAFGGILASTVVQLVMGGNFLLIPIAALAALLAGGIALLSSGIGTLSRLSRYKMYLKTLGQRTSCGLDQLAKSVGKSTKFVKKELQSMIDEGLFLQGHMDAEERNLITSDETFRRFEQGRAQMEERKRLEELEAQRKQAAQAVSPQVQEVLDRGHAFIRQIRSCNDAIPGEEISDKISRMELLVRRIFERAEAHPEIVPDLKKLMDYYLPMTVKLLNAYADMDRQPIQGETIQASKQEIEKTLDTLNTAFEKLLDSVFRETAMDVSSDISVLHTLLAQEGLTDDDFTRIRKENNG